MRQWLRRNCWREFALASLASLTCGSGLLQAQQELPAQTKRNILRTPGPSETTSKFGRNAVEEPPAMHVDKSHDEEPILIIGSADTILTSGDDSQPVSFASIASEPEFDSTIVLEIATASLSHVSPFFFWMAGPTSDFLRPNSEATQRFDEFTSDEMLGSPADDSDGNEYVGTIAPYATAGDESVEPDRIVSTQVDTESPTPARKPTPRTVRMPFEVQGEEETQTTNIAINKNKKSVVPQRDPDSDQEQEEPKLDPRNRVIDREHQGIDAQNASKPGSFRREIRIDDAQAGRVVPPAVPRKSMEPATALRLQRTASCLEHYLKNPETTAERSPWAVMHALIAFGGDYELIHSTGRVNAIGWMCHNGTCRTQRMFTPKGNGFTPNVGGGVQGHEGQFLAILAQSNVPLDYPIQIGSTKFTVEDLVRYEMATCKEKTELTFKLIGLSYYLDSNKQWKANDGKTWSISRLIQEELAQPIVGSACGGTHRLMGFSFSVRQRQLQGQPLNGQFARAAKFVKDYITYTWQLQNPDGSFSTNWYEGRGNEPNDERKVQTSGHMLEWLMFTLPDEEINQPRVAKSIEFLLTKIYDQRERKWPIGPRGHATRAIALYTERMNSILNAASADPVRQYSASKSTAAPTRK